MMAADYHSVLGLHISSRGFGWIVFDGPESVFDWGTVEVRGDAKNDTAMARIGRLLEKYHPQVVAIEAFAGRGARRCARIRRLYARMIRKASGRATVKVFRRTDIATSLASSAGRDHVAEAVAHRVPALRPRLPKRRKIWMGEHPNLALFSAAACGLAYYAAVADGHA